MVKPLDAAQAMLDMMAGLPAEAQADIRAAVRTVLTPVCGGALDRAAEVVGAAERMTRRVSSAWLAELLAEYQGRWAEAERARAAADTHYLAGGGEVSVEQDEYDRFTLTVSDGARVDTAYGHAELTGAEGLNLVRLLLAQPAVQNARRDAGPDWEAGGRG